MTEVGIETIGVYPCTLTLPMEALCEARGQDPAHIANEMMITERSVNPPFEDPVTMAVHAGQIALKELEADQIGLLLVCTESGVDQEKPMSTWVQRYLGLSAQCRNMEIKHACYSGTGAMQLAASWVASPAARGRKALVITSDQSRMHLNQPWEFVMGAGATAFVVSTSPDFLVLEPGASGVYTEEVSDLTRPTSRVETGNSETSLISYLNALEEAFDDFVANAGPINFDEDFAYHLYHVPFGGLTLRAHRAMLRRLGISDWDTVRAHFERKTSPSLTYNRRMGGTYAGALFVAMLGLVDQTEAIEGKPVSVFSYGSGCCSEFYRAKFGGRAKARARSANLLQRLNDRRVLSVDEYEAIEQQRTDQVDQGDFEPALDVLPRLIESHYQSTYGDERRLLFRGCRKHIRQYTWAQA